MDATVPPYVVERIRAELPQGVPVVRGSTPVVSFGDARAATVATLGLNPSRAEFLGPRGDELKGTQRRLATLSSLGVPDLATAPLEVVAQVFEECNCYFERAPYRDWFDKLEAVLNTVEASYYDGSACHLDLAQWATDPVWGKMPKEARKALLDRDGSFLIDQLENERIRLLLLNGTGVIRGFQRVSNTRMQEITPPVPGNRHPTRMFMGQTRTGIRTIGWSTNLQSSWGVTAELRAAVTKRVGELARDL